MERFEVTILGCGSAAPTTLRHPSAQVVNVREKIFLVDCGEGTQTQYRRCRFNFMKLRHIFISHLHGDHCFGLPGLISTLALSGRTEPLTLHSPAGLRQGLSSLLETFCAQLTYPLRFEEFPTDAPALIYDDRSLTVHTIPLNHRIPCCGFLFAEKPLLRHLRRDMLDFYQIPIAWRQRIKQGEDFPAPDGTLIPNARLTTDPTPARRYAYCSDTAFSETYLEQIRHCDLLYHEATFAESEADQARQRYHSTAAQAAEAARRSEARRLLLGHFSARYPDCSQLLQEAQAVFPPSLLAQEGKTYAL
ncbi:MAG: ribonuclease Z [Bacteroidaceae bacterium]|jgi:ribonuclease Z